MARRKRTLNFSVPPRHKWGSAPKGSFPREWHEYNARQMKALAEIKNAGETVAGYILPSNRSR